jgi:hypothetical protein
VRTARIIDEDVRRPLATDPLHFIFEFSSSSSEDEDEDFALPRHFSSDIEHVVKEAICTVRVCPKIHSASHHKRSPNEHSDEDFSSGSDGGEEYSSTHSGEYSSDEEGLHLESEGTWEVISIWGIHYIILLR